MNASWDIALIVVGMLAAAIAGGTFFAFSNFVMPALSTMSAPGGVRAMQAINRAAPNPWFAAALVLGVLAGVPVLVAEVGVRGESATRLVAAAIALSAVSLVITLVQNVPKNDQLESLDADSAAAAAYWKQYVPTWTLDNTLRGLASLASAVVYAMSLRGR